MSISTFTFTVITLAILTLAPEVNAQSASYDPRIREQMKCLRQTALSQCNLEVIYPSPVSKLKCNEYVSQDSGTVLKGPPSLRVQGLRSSIPRAVLVMFDPDAPMTIYPIDGFIHYLATVSIDSRGRVRTERVYKEYYIPTPPRGQGPHRYQFFLFRFTSSGDVRSAIGRRFQLCPFVRANNLSQPVAAFQYRYGRE